MKRHLFRTAKFTADTMVRGTETYSQITLGPHICVVTAEIGSRGKDCTLPNLVLGGIKVAKSRIALVRFSVVEIAS